MKSGWLNEGPDPPKQHAGYKRDYLMPRLKGDGGLEPKPAGYADDMVATAGLLHILGLPLELRGYWTEHSERSVLPTALSLMGTIKTCSGVGSRKAPTHTFFRSFGGRVARLQALFADVARGADCYIKLDEREVAADLVPWLWSGRGYRACRPNSLPRACGDAGRRGTLESQTLCPLPRHQRSFR